MLTSSSSSGGGGGSLPPARPLVVTFNGPPAVPAPGPVAGPPMPAYRPTRGASKTRRAARYTGATASLAGGSIAVLVGKFRKANDRVFNKKDGTKRHWIVRLAIWGALGSVGALTGAALVIPAALLVSRVVSSKKADATIARGKRAIRNAERRAKGLPVERAPQAPVLGQQPQQGQAPAHGYPQQSQGPAQTQQAATSVTPMTSHQRVTESVRIGRLAHRNATMEAAMIKKTNAKGPERDNAERAVANRANPAYGKLILAFGGPRVLNPITMTEGRADEARRLAVAKERIDAFFGGDVEKVLNELNSGAPKTTDLTTRVTVALAVEAVANGIQVNANERVGISDFAASMAGVCRAELGGVGRIDSDRRVLQQMPLDGAENAWKIEAALTASAHHDPLAMRADVKLVGTKAAGRATGLGAGI